MASLLLCFAAGIYFDLIVSVPKNEELRNLRSSRDILFIEALDRFLMSLRLLIVLAIKNYCSFYYPLLSIQFIKFMYKLKK